MRSILKLICVILISFAFPLCSEENLDTQTVKNEFTRMTLSNGMRVILKKTTYDSDEIVIRLQAKGGYASLPLEKRAAAVIAPQVVRESNFTNIVSNMLSDEDFDFDIEIMPYFRGIQGYCVPADLDNILKAIKIIFSSPKMSKEAFNTVVLETKKKMLRKNADFEEIFQQTFFSINSNDFPAYRSFRAEEFERVDLRVCQEIYTEFFSNPAEFDVIVVGNFDLKTINEKIEAYLGSIPQKSHEINFNHVKFPSEPSKPIDKEIKVPLEKSSLARFTLVVDSPISKDDYLKTKIVSLYLQDRIEEVVRKVYNKDIGLEVLDQWQAYPFTNQLWLFFQFRTDFSKVLKIKFLIIEELKKISLNGISEAELSELKTKLAEEDEFWLRDNQYWLMHLLDYINRGWEVTDNFGSYKEFDKFKAEEVNKFIKTRLNINKYTFLYNGAS